MKSEYVKKWITKADNDLKVAKHEMERNDPVTENAFRRGVPKWLK